MHCENYIWSIERVDEYCFPVEASAASTTADPLSCAHADSVAQRPRASQVLFLDQCSSEP